MRTLRCGFILVVFFLVFFLIHSLNLFCSIKENERKLNIVLIVIDALRRDHLSCYGYFRETSPTIDKLSKEGVFFSDAISQSSQTGPAIASLFTGLYPSHHGVQFYSHSQSFHPSNKDTPPNLSDQFKTLAEYFRSAGYTTLGIVSNPWLKAEYGYGQGFEFYEFIGSWEGKWINNTFSDCLQKQLKNKTFFAYLHYMDVHAPYYNPHTFKGLYTPYKGDHVYGNGYIDTIPKEDLEYSIALYDEEINYADGLINNIIEQLRESSIIEKTIIVITSDHGDEFFEHQGIGHGTTLYSELINTFFILYNPGHLGPKKIDKKVKSADFFPTILDIFGIDHEKNQIDGKSLLPLMEDSDNYYAEKSLRFSELGDKKAIISDRWKYIYNPFLKTEKLYNMETDKKERFNRVDREGRLRKRFKGWILSQMGDGFYPASESDKISEAQKARLKSLGYIKDKSHYIIKDDNELKMPITDKIDFTEHSFNPLQLIYGWKRLERDGNRVFCWIGPKAKFVLMRGSKRQDKLLLEGNVVLKNFPDLVQKIIIFCEKRKLGEYTLNREGVFSVSFKVPDDLGKSRSLEFTIICDNYFNSSLIVSNRGERNNPVPLKPDDKSKKDLKLSLQIYSIYFK